MSPRWLDLIWFPTLRKVPVSTVCRCLQAVLVCPRYYIAEVLRSKRKFGIYKWDIDDIAGHEFWKDRRYHEFWRDDEHYEVHLFHDALNYVDECGWYLPHNAHLWERDGAVPMPHGPTMSQSYVMSSPPSTMVTPEVDLGPHWLGGWDDYISCFHLLPFDRDIIWYIYI